MNCDGVCALIDDYLENRLTRYERQQLEMHMTFCPNCAEELRTRPALEQTMWRALSSSVQHLHLSPEASIRIVREAQGSLGRARRAERVSVGARVLAGVAAVAFLFVGLLLVAGQIRIPMDFQPAIEPQASQPSVLVNSGDVFIEPWDMRPGEAFTVTVFMRSNLSEPLGSVPFELTIEGPTGHYRFAMAARGPLPARGVSVFQVTSKLLEEPCREQYQISPQEIMSVPGTYTLRTVMLVPVTKTEK